MIKLEVLEINATRHCVNRCANCNHASAFAEPYEMSPEVLDRDLKALSKIARIRYLSMQGGEPMLHTRLMDMLTVMINARMCEQPWILTNARLSLKMKEEFWEFIGKHRFEFRVSEYPNLEPVVKPYVEKKAKIYGFSTRWQYIDSFVKVFAKHNDPQAIFNRCPWTKCYTVHEGFFYKCPLTTFWPSEFMGLPATIDGIPIEGITESSFNEFVNSTKFLESCRICSGADGARVKWHENSNREEWLKEAEVCIQPTKT